MKKLKEILSELVTVDQFIKDNKKALEDTQPLHDSLNKHYSKFSEVHKEHLRKYSDSSYGINNMLWKQYKNEPLTANDKIELNDLESPKVEHIDSAIAKHKTPHELTLHAGIKYDPRKKMNAEKIVHHPAYLSTSLSHRIARGFSNTSTMKDRHVLSIKVPKGHPGAYIGEHSYSSDEREFLLPKGLNLKYTGTESSEYDHPTGRLKVHTHHMEIVK